MRLVDFKSYKKVRRSVTMRNGLIYGIPMGLLLFLITVSQGFFEALLFGVIVSVLILAFVFVIREFSQKRVERRRVKALFESAYIDVFYRGEMGAISILDNRLKYHTLTPGNTIQDFDIMITENLYLDAGAVTYNTLQSLKYKGIHHGYIIAHEVPTGVTYKFTFYDIHNVLAKVIHRIDEVSQFKGENIDAETKDKN